MRDDVKPLPEPAKWAQRIPARRFRVFMEPIARAILAERERDTAEADLAAAQAREQALRAALTRVLDGWEMDTSTFRAKYGSHPDEDDLAALLRPILAADPEARDDG